MADKVIEFTPDTPTYNIKKMLRAGGNFHFHAGRYHFRTFLILRSNTHVECDEGAIFERGHYYGIMTTAFKSDTKFYQGEHDITWKGGTFIGNTNEKAGSLVHIFHAQNITFEDCTFLNCVTEHFVEIVASKMVYFINCTFKDHQLSIRHQDKEAMLIDFAKKSPLRVGTGIEPMYDGQHCNNIVIEGCTFENCRNGIGTHDISVGMNPIKHHSQIYIQHCKFIGHNIGKGIAILFLNSQTVRISDCEIDGFGSAIVLGKRKKGISPAGIPANNKDLKRCEILEIKRNKITRCLQDIQIQ